MAEGCDKESVITGWRCLDYLDEVIRHRNCDRYRAFVLSLLGIEPEIGLAINAHDLPWAKLNDVSPPWGDFQEQHHGEVSFRPQPVVLEVLADVVGLPRFEPFCHDFPLLDLLGGVGFQSPAGLGVSE